MSDSGGGLQELLDREAIRQQLANYCRAVDRHDFALGHGVFHEDATADYGAELYQGPARGVIDFVIASHAGALNHTHQLCQSTIAFDGEKAGSETYFHSATRMMIDGKLSEVRVYGRYLDRWSRRDGRWAIDARRTLFDFDELREVVRTDRFDQGTRDASDPSYAFLKGQP